jgi:chemotaxis protein MotB
MARRRKPEELERHEAWAIPYGDLVTLLLAFFVVMYSISSVNEGKYRVVSDSLTQAFHGTPRAPQPITLGQTPMQPIEQQLPLTQVNRMIAEGLPAPRLLSQRDPAQPLLVLTYGERPASDHGKGDAVGPLEASPAAAATPAATPASESAAQELGRVADDVGAAMRGLIASGQVKVHRHDTWVGVDISTDILFPSGVARLSPSAVGVLQRLADAVKPWPNAIRVEGHTDDRPISNAAFPSNWELSAARAASVVHLFMDRGVSAERMAVLGFGPYRPVAPNATLAGRNSNRRVELVILSRDSAPEEGL